MMFTGVIIIIQSRPYDDQDLRTFLIPDNCPPPCWQGIQPGHVSNPRLKVEAFKSLNAYQTQPFEATLGANI